MNKKICFATVIFDQNLPFFSQFLNSINNQSIKNFQLLLFNEGIINIHQFLIDLSIPYTVINLNKTNSIAENRVQLFKYLINSDFDYCIFGDSDDYFPTNRIEINVNLLENTDIVINETKLVDNQSNIIKEKYFNLHNNQPIKFNDILTKNCCGLGNTAIRINVLPSKFEFTSTVAAIDWMLFSKILLNGNTAIFTNDTYIYYRQHDLNLIGLKSITSDRILLGIETKLKHYQYFYKNFNICGKELKQMEMLNEYCSNQSNMQSYLNKILSLKMENPMWWEEIIPLELIN